jgi:predicted short-subunit dehydrogenase-like oxidoreductase (DUF2520 family)
MSRVEPRKGGPDPRGGLEDERAILAFVIVPIIAMAVIVSAEAQRPEAVLHSYVHSSGWTYPVS